jgi:hypothetical protein
MILIRNVFHLKFGQAKEAVTIWKEMVELMRNAEIGSNHRLLTDLAGTPYYTLIFEVSFPSLPEWRGALDSEEQRRLYERFIPLVESGSREIYNIVQ